jgi:hypothetical protein
MFVFRLLPALRTGVEAQAFSRLAGTAREGPTSLLPPSSDDAASLDYDSLALSRRSMKFRFRLWLRRTEAR